MAVAILPRELPSIGLTHHDGYAAALKPCSIAAASVDNVGIESADTI
jgi:hypothetical protein